MPRLRLEEFGTAGAQPDPATGEEDVAHQTAYEDGYAAGWEDAVAAQATNEAQLATAVADHLRSLSLLVEDARSQLLATLEPLFADLCTGLLPEMARLTLGPVVADAMMPMAEQMVDRPMRLRASAATRGPLEAYLAQAGTVPFEVVEDPSLGDGQVVVATDRIEAKVDLDAATAAIARKVRAFFDSQQMERHDAE
ncbi:MAG: flagellar biosynthesis protein [Rhodobacter sp. CACIA14H1]|nr:MAG: flagellar biosynthesis protein [Rhodobacter sp. CACIA14H1]